MLKNILEHADDRELTEKSVIDDIEIGEAALRVIGLKTESQKPLNTHELEEIINSKAEKALGDCEFEITPEISDAIKGFYTDHLLLKEAIKAAVNGNYDSDIFKKILEVQEYEDWEKRLAGQKPFYENASGYRPSTAPNAKVYALRLATYINSVNTSEEKVTVDIRQKILSLSGQSMTGLFNESSVGISTLSEEEINETSELADEIIKQAGTEVMFSLGASNRGYFMRGSQVRASIEHAKEVFWGDVRHAGSLLFHGSNDVGSINLHGIMSRNQQLRKLGKMNNTTALNMGGDTMHSVVTHFSEFYGMGQYSGGEEGGTIALPLIKVIEQAPYARDAQYSVVKMKKSAEHEIPVPVIDRPIADSGVGEPDYVNAQGRDRVFFASSDEHGDKLPDDYEISLFDKNNKPATYIILREPGKNSSSRELVHLGNGFGFPERVVIDLKYSSSSDLSETYESQRESARAHIVELQKAYIEAYRNYGFIVPLRRGVFAQVFENMPLESQKGRDQAVKYNSYTAGTGRRA